MYDTYRIMSAKLPKDLQEKDLEELCTMYAKADAEFTELREKLNEAELAKAPKEVITELSNKLIRPSKQRNDIYRTMYCKLFPMMLAVQKNYTTLTPVQRVEVTKMILISTLRCYSQNTKIKTKFSTYYMTNLKRGMLTQINSMKCNKRCVWSNMIENEEQSNYTLATQSTPDSELNIDTFLKHVDNSTYLSSAEKAYIHCVMDNGNLTDKLKKNETIETKTYPSKIGAYINNLNEKNGFATNPIAEDEEKSLAKKLKKSIRQKFLKLDRELFYV